VPHTLEHASSTHVLGYVRIEVLPLPHAPMHINHRKKNGKNSPQAIVARVLEHASSTHVHGYMRNEVLPLSYAPMHINYDSRACRARKCIFFAVFLLQVRGKMPI